jgi:DNA segregation ATPase FtsK/SpoIIIE-like protein
LPVVTDMKQAAQALKWAVDEMERRYQLFADAGTKNIGTFNRYVERVAVGELPAPRVATVQAVDHNGDLMIVAAAKNGTEGAALPERLPYIVVVIDEFADLMMQQGKEVETSVARLAQKARAAGMHVILATQRPSVDVITGMIKANFPSRIAFRVAQRVDSRTILDEQGAEVLLGRGDMLVKLNGGDETIRVQCPFISEEEVSALTDHLRAQGHPHAVGGRSLRARGRQARRALRRGPGHRAGDGALLDVVAAAQDDHRLQPRRQDRGDAGTARLRGASQRLQRPGDFLPRELTQATLTPRPSAHHRAVSGRQLRPFHHFADLSL